MASDTPHVVPRVVMLTVDNYDHGIECSACGVLMNVVLDPPPALVQLPHGSVNEARYAVVHNLPECIGAVI